MFRQIHHVAIITGKYQEAKHFYVDKLGFSVIRETQRPGKGEIKLDLALDGCELEIFGVNNPPQRVTFPEAAGLRHLAFWVENIYEAVKELNAAGIETEPIRMDDITEKHFTFFRDPDGLPLELHE